MEFEVNDIDIKEILFSGACFRCNLESDGSITNILSDRVINIKQDGNKVLVNSSNYDNLKEIIYDYFDLNRDYDSINKELVNMCPSLKDTINKCKKYRILNQNPFEMGISYIISQNNNVKRISNSINKLSIKYGKKVIFDNKEYYLFPKYEALKSLDESDFKELGVGFRDKYIVNYLKEYPNLSDLDNLSTTDALRKLMYIKGIGLKVASCILLFGYRRLDVFPIDTWVKKYMSENYNIKSDTKEIEKYADNHFGKYSGLVIQYMFHSQRNRED